MTTSSPTQQVFWLASRAFGIVAIVLLAISVAFGLTMSGRLARKPGLPAKIKHFHEASMLVALRLIVAHAGVLLADGYLRPGLAGITLPFQLSYRPLWTGIGVIAGWLTVIFTLSFYARRWIGVKTWRWLHRWTLTVYVLALGHAIGAGTDGHSAWMITMLTAPIMFAFTYRRLPTAPRPARHNSRSPATRKPVRRIARTSPGTPPHQNGHRLPDKIIKVLENLRFRTEALPTALCLYRLRYACLCANGTIISGARCGRADCGSFSVRGVRPSC